MNDQVSLLLQGYAAKRKLAELFQSEGLGQADQPPIAIAAHESIPAVQTDIKQSSKLFREDCRKHGLDRNRTPTALRTSQLAPEAEGRAAWANQDAAGRY